MQTLTKTPAHPRPQLATEDCSLFYNLRKLPLADVINAAIGLKDGSVLRHALKCGECRMHIQMREQFSSESEMDIELFEALGRIGQCP